MAKVSFHPLIQSLTGRIGRLVYRRSHNGTVSAYPSPDMTGVAWSQAQKEQRRRLGEASRYASAAIGDPELRRAYVQMAESNQMNRDRPFDMAVRDYLQNGNDLLWKKHMGDREKPANWSMDLYPWYAKEKYRRRKRSAS